MQAPRRAPGSNYADGLAKLKDLVAQARIAEWQVRARRTYRHPANMAPTTACPTNWCALSTQKIQIGAVP